MSELFCWQCPQNDRAEKIAADARQQVDAAWSRLRLVYLAAHAAGVDLDDEGLRYMCREDFITAEQERRERDALDGFHGAVTMAIFSAEKAELDPANAWRNLVCGLHKKYPAHPAAKVSRKDCEQEVDRRFAAMVRDCPPPGDATDPYGTPPLLGVEWSEQQQRGDAA